MGDGTESAIQQGNFSTASPTKTKTWEIKISRLQLEHQPTCTYIHLVFVLAIHLEVHTYIEVNPMSTYIQVVGTTIQGLVF